MRTQGTRPSLQAVNYVRRWGSDTVNKCASQKTPPTARLQTQASGKSGSTCGVLPSRRDGGCAQPCACASVRDAQTASGRTSVLCGIDGDTIARHGVCRVVLVGAVPSTTLSAVVCALQSVTSSTQLAGSGQDLSGDRFDSLLGGPTSPVYVDPKVVCCVDARRQARKHPTPTRYRMDVCIAQSLCVSKYRLLVSAARREVLVLSEPCPRVHTAITACKYVRLFVLSRRPAG